MPSKVIYTVLINNYDILNEPVHSCVGIDFICVTNNRELKSSLWNFIYVDLINDDPIITSRYYKFFPHLFFSSYDVSIYVDSSFKLISNNYQQLFSDLSSSLVSAPIHPVRDCIYDEIHYLKTMYDTPEQHNQFNLLIARYEDCGFPHHFGLAEMGFIFRYHNHPAIINLMDMWWAEFNNGIKRDQLYFMYCLWKSRLNFSYSSFSFRKINKYFCHFSHDKNLFNFISIRLIIKCLFNRIYSFF